MTALEPTFQTKLDYVLSQGLKEGTRFDPYWLVLDPWQQGQLWCQSRTLVERYYAIQKLREEGADWLADVLQSIQTTSNRWATNDLPGQSWHQWGEAAAVKVVVESSRSVWITHHPAYEQLARLAREVNLTTGRYWKARDPHHLQLRSDAVRAYYSWKEIDQAMKERYDERRTKR